MENNVGIIVQVLIALVGIFGSGFSAYMGVKVALTKIETRQDNHDRDIAKLDNRVTYIERHLFHNRRDDE